MPPRATLMMWSTSRRSVLPQLTHWLLSRWRVCLRSRCGAPRDGFSHMLHLLIFVPYSSRELVACVPSVCSRHPALAVGEGLAVRLGAPVWLHSDCLLGNFPGRKTTKTPAVAGV